MLVYTSTGMLTRKNRTGPPVAPKSASLPSSTTRRTLNPPSTTTLPSGTLPPPSPPAPPSAMPLSQRRAQTLLPVPPSPLQAGKQNPPILTLPQRYKSKQALTNLRIKGPDQRERKHLASCVAQGGRACHLARQLQLRVWIGVHYHQHVLCWLCRRRQGLLLGR